MLQAAEQNLGIALARELLAADALRERPAVPPVVAGAARGDGDAYWLVYPPDLHDWPPLATLRRWLHDEIDASARAWSASDASPMHGARGLRGVRQVGGRNSGCRSRQEIEAALARPHRRRVALDQAAALGLVAAPARSPTAASPVRSTNALRLKPSRKRSALSMNSNGSASRAHFVLVAHGLRRPAPASCRSPARASAPGAPRGAESSACRARRRRCRGSRRTASSSGCAGTAARPREGRHLVARRALRAACARRSHRACRWPGRRRARSGGCSAKRVLGSIVRW